MTDEVKAHLFEPFFTTKEKGKGTGLGLSTVYGIVKQSNGHILFYSELGQGTTFKIFLPRVEEEITAIPRRDDLGYMPKGNETILLVEDEPLVRGLAIRVLREQGYNLLEAANGMEALSVAQEHANEKIHLLLTDVIMPQLGGKELADRLKKLRPNVEVLFTSGYTDQAILQRGLLNPDFAFLEKPFSPSGLVRKVREVLDR
jgi:CheY-like chemotaxis protein